MTAQSLDVVFLGTGTSHGIPMIGCDCAVCRSDDCRDRRNRASIAVSGGGTTLLIDTPPELRLAAVACGVERVDAILFTHTHADHIMGLDDARRFNDVAGKTIDCYAGAGDLDRLREVFGYAEVRYADAPASRPSLRFRAMDGPVSIGGLEVVPVPLLHGADAILGFRIGRMAYCTDCSAVPEASRPLLEGLDLLVLDALRHTPHPTHFSVSGALAEIERIRPRRTLLTHVAHEIGHEAVSATLPEGVALAHDGLHTVVRCDGSRD